MVFLMLVILQIKCYLCSIPPGAYYDFNLDVSGSLDASLSVHGNVYVFNTMLWSIGSSGSGGVGEGESVQDLVACQGLSYAMGENGSQFQFTTPENGTVVNTDHVIVAVKAESGSGQFTLTLSRGVMLQLGEGVTGSISFDLLSGRRYAFWRFVGRAHTLYTANVNYTVHNITETARANVYGVFVGYASDFTGGFSRFNVSDVAVETFKKMYSASQGYTNPLFMTPTYGGLTTGFQVCTPFFSEGVKLFGFAFVDIVSWGVVSVDYAEANITLTSLEPNLVKVGEPYVGSIAGKGLVGDLVAVELGGGYCYNFTFRCYGVNPAVEVRSGSGEYFSVFRTLVDYERLPASKSFVVFSGEGGVCYVYVFCIEGEGEYVLTITHLIGSDSLLFYALAFLCLHYLQLQGATAQTLMLGGISALIIGLIIFVYLLGNIKHKF